MSAIEMHKLVITEIRAEYQHNISQQIYVTEMSWAVVKRIKEQTIGIIGSAANALPAQASAIDLSKSVLNHLANLETENPYDLALSIVKKDIQSLF
jgi:UDP-N-acetylmuramyl pentapeptide synthase